MVLNVSNKILFQSLLHVFIVFVVFRIEWLKILLVLIFVFWCLILLLGVPIGMLTYLVGVHIVVLFLVIVFSHEVYIHVIKWLSFVQNVLVFMRSFISEFCNDWTYVPFGNLLLSTIIQYIITSSVILIVWLKIFVLTQFQLLSFRCSGVHVFALFTIVWSSFLVFMLLCCLLVSGPMPWCSGVCGVCCGVHCCFALSSVLFGLRNSDVRCSSRSARVAKR